MEESPIGKWFPFDIDWFRRARASWDPAWVGPVLNLLMDMWPKGCALEDRDEVLARTAGVPLKTWLEIRRDMGAFWAVVDGKFTQPFLAAAYASAIEKAERRVERASKGGKAKQEKARERLAKDLAAQAASGSAPSGASSTAPSTSQVVLEEHTRAIVNSSSSSGERREEAIASAVPEPAYIRSCFEAYPRTRGKGAANRAVPIPADAMERIAAFLLDRPTYPLLEVFRAIGKTCDFPPSLADFLAAPWDAESTIRSAAAAAPKGQGGKTPFLAERERKAAEEAEAWENMTAEEQAAVKAQAEEVKRRALGRRTA